MHTQPLISDLELMDKHARALFTHDARNRLLTINEPDGGSAAGRFYLARTPAGNLWRFRADLPQSLVADLEALCQAEPMGAPTPEPPRHMDAYLRLLQMHAPIKELWSGPAYCFTHRPEPTGALLAMTTADAGYLPGDFAALIEELPTWQPFVGLVEEGKVVSVCRSVRITPAAHEAGVETLPAFRGRGYASNVVAAWARLVQQMGAIPMYSTSWENRASQAVARRLGLHQVGADFHIT